MYMENLVYSVEGRFCPADPVPGPLGLTSGKESWCSSGHQNTKDKGMGGGRVPGFRAPRTQTVCVFLCFMYTTSVQQGPGGAPWKCLCIPTALTLTLRRWLCRSTPNLIGCPSEHRRGPGRPYGLGGCWPHHPEHTASTPLSGTPKVVQSMRMD